MAASTQLNNGADAPAPEPPTTLPSATSHMRLRVQPHTAVPTPHVTDERRETLERVPLPAVQAVAIPHVADVPIL